MRFSFVLIAVGMLLAGCVQEDTIFVPPKLTRCDGPDHDGHTDELMAYKGKTFWVYKNVLIHVCQGYVRWWDWRCGNIEPGEVETMKSGWFKVDDVWCDDKDHVIDFKVTTESGHTGWVYAGLWNIVEIVAKHDVVDHPWSEKLVGGPVRIGMTRRQVIDSDLGLPLYTTTWQTKNHEFEKWTYKYPDYVDLFFEDGKVFMIKR